MLDSTTMWCGLGESNRRKLLNQIVTKMEPWEVSHIRRNKFNLQQHTICNNSFRAVLQEHGVLGGNDFSQLEAVQNSKGIHAESELLYNILLTREGAFNALIDAFKKTKQTGALHILQRGSLEHIQNHFTNWNELSDDFKTEMRNKLVNFQGKKLKLSECYNHLHHLIDGKLLTELAKGNSPTLVSNQVPEQLEYYIQRTLRSRNRLKSSVFQQPCDDVFVVQGLEKYELTSLVAGARTDVSGNQIERLTVRYILLEFEGDFERICKLTSFPVHFIRHKDNIYEWVKSTGSVKTLQLHVDDVQDDFSEEKLASRGNRVNVIPDSPGMGKTFLLANIAHRISKQKPNMLIRFLVMKDVVQALSKKTINLKCMLSFIAERSSEFECGRKIVIHNLTSEPCILMFDGFDEVPFHQIDIAKKILSTIVTLKSARILVTTRPHLRGELEDLLNVLGYTINPFTKSDQVNFLLKFWKMKGAAENETLKQFATECVNTINSNMTDFERDIAGIPLQCRLLAECYTEQALRWSQIGAPPINSKPMGQINSIFEMYQRHMKMRLENQVEAIKNAHIYYALKLLFREQVHQFQALKSPSILLSELCAAGFLEATNSDSDVQFVHRTFAEFFVAWFAVEMKMPEKITPFLLHELLATKSRNEFITTPVGKVNLGLLHTFSYPVIAYFINGFSKIYSKNQEDQDQPKRIAMIINSVYYAQVSRIFLASAFGDYQFVPLLVSLCFEPLQITEKVNSDILKLLLISAKYSSVALVNTFCSQVELTKLKSPFEVGLVKLTPLHVAVQRGHYRLVEFLARKYELELKNLRSLFHFCVFESLKDNKAIITEKAQIIKLLSRKSSVWLDEELSDGTVPLLQETANCELIKYLIECGADVNVLDKNRNSILHKIVQNPVTPEFYHWLVVCLNDRKFKHFNHSNWKKVKPLHCALEKVELLADTLEYFHLNGTDFNAEDKDEESPLFYAIRGGRSVSLICALIELGADWKKRNKACETALHICAKHGHYHAMMYFVDFLKMDVKETDIYGNTPLPFAAMGHFGDDESMQQLVVPAGANVHTKNEEEEQHTSFREVFKFTFNIIKLLEKRGLLIKPDYASKVLTNLLSNRNVMSGEVGVEFTQLLEFLIGKGGEVKDIASHNAIGNRICNVWESEGVQKNIPAIVQATDLDCLWPHLNTSGLLTQSELEDIQKLSIDSYKKCECFYKAVQAKTGSFERVCILMIASNQMSSVSLLRQALYSSLFFGDSNMFMVPPTFAHQFLHSQQNSGLNIMLLVTNNPYLTVWRIGDTIRDNIVLIEEADISSLFQKPTHNDIVVVKVRVVTAELITKFEAKRATQGKTLFVCSSVDEDIKNCHVVTESLSTWDAISSQYLKEKALVNLFHDSYGHIFEFFESPLILSKLSQPQLSQNEYHIVKFEAGHFDTVLQTKRYLCPTIFHYALPDKLVFQGIPIEKLKEFARFGHKIGKFGEDDVENLDFLVIEQSHQFNIIYKQTSENVHLVKYDKEKQAFKLVKTWGWEDNIQWYLKTPLCEGFPHCDCAPGNDNLAVRLLLDTEYRNINHRFECTLPVHELTPRTLTFMKLEDAEELFNIKALLKRLGKQQAEQADFLLKSHREQIAKLVTNQLSTVLVEDGLYHIAINTLFPNLIKQTKIIEGLEKYQQLGMLKQIENNQMVFVYQSLAWYLIANLLMGLTENVAFEGITSELRKEVFQNCLKPQEMETSTLHSSEFTLHKRICFGFIDTLLENNDSTNFRGVLKDVIALESEGHKWVHACVNANLFYLLQLITSLNVNGLSLAFQSEKLVMLAVNHADLQTTRLIFQQYERETKDRVTDIALCPNYDVFAMGLLAVLRGNYKLVQYLLDYHSLGVLLKRNDKKWKVYYYCLAGTVNNRGKEVNERKRIIDLLLQNDDSSVHQIRPYLSNIHVDLILYLIHLGVDIYSKDTRKNHILHLCPSYLTPEEYHKVASIIHSKDNTSIARLFQEFNSDGETAFHVAVEYLELLDDTIVLFSEARVNFNALNEERNSIFVHASKHFRSARFLDTLYRFGADIKARDKNGRPASDYCQNDQTVMRYLSSRGVPVYEPDKDASKT